jgi:hypothetical protein
MEYTQDDLGGQDDMGCLIVFGILFVILMIGMFCGDEPKPKGPPTYILQSGITVKCSYAQVDDCGLTLSGCMDGNVYMCQKNLVKK